MLFEKIKKLPKNQYNFIILMVHFRCFYNIFLLSQKSDWSKNKVPLIGQQDMHRSERGASQDFDQEKRTYDAKIRSCVTIMDVSHQID